MKIGFDPINKQDAYIDIVKRIFEDLGCEVVDFNSEALCAHPTIDAAYLNWFENMPHGKWHKNVLSFAKRLLILGWLKYKKIPIIYVAHNLALHNSNGARFADTLIRLCLKNAAVVGQTVSCTKTMFLEKRNIRIPDTVKCMLLSIPNYEVEDVYRPNTDILQDGHRLKVLNFGMVRPYKNIEAIIELAKRFPQIDFRVVGNAALDYGEELLRKADGVENITFLFKYVSDEELNEEILNCDLVLLPYHKESMLNSGALRHASILGRSVVCPIIGNSYELNHDGYYFYDYASDAQHLEQLTECFQRIAADFAADPAEIARKGENARTQHLEKYNYERVKANYAEVLEAVGSELRVGKI